MKMKTNPNSPSSTPAALLPYCRDCRDLNAPPASSRRVWLVEAHRSKPRRQYVTAWRRDRSRRERRASPEEGRRGTLVGNVIHTQRRRRGRQSPTDTPDARSFQLGVQVSQGCELAGVCRGARRLGLAASVEIAAAEQVRGGNDRRAHGAVFIGSLRPGDVVVQPKIKAHWRHFTTRRSIRRPVRSTDAGRMAWAAWRNGESVEPVRGQAWPRHKLQELSWRIPKIPQASS